MSQTTPSKTHHLKVSSLDVLDEFREIFSLVDRDGSNSISTSELRELFDIIGIEATADEVDRMVREVDIDRSGEINFEEFAEIMSRRVHTRHSSDDVKDAFKVFRDYTAAPAGHVQVDRLAEYLFRYHRRDGRSNGGGDENRRRRRKEEAEAKTEATTERSLVSLERAAELAEQLEVDQNGMANYKELVDMMMHW